MNQTAEEKLLYHVDHDMYDKQGFVSYRNIGKTLEIKVKNLASAIGITSRSLQKNPKSEKTQVTLRKIAYTYRTLKEMLGSEEKALKWLRAPNPDYNGTSPLEIISQGKVDAIIRYLDDIKKGSLT